MYDGPLKIHAMATLLDILVWDVDHYVGEWEEACFEAINSARISLFLDAISFASTSLLLNTAAD